MSFRAPTLVALALLTLVISGCQNSPERVSKQLGLTHKVIQTGLLNHAVFANGNTDTSGYVHIYIGGDGRPWLRGRHISADPTSHNPIALKMAAADPSRAVYVARPCYFIQSSDPRCESDLWTFGRYSQLVIDSMAEAIEQVIAESDASDVILFGYSGGGVIATLVAEKLANVTALVTVAANLDIDAWTKQHNYLPLSHSLNPQTGAKLSEAMVQIHLFGGRDENVSPEITRSFVKRHGGRLWEYETFDHRCCWLEAWPQILRRVEGAVIAAH